jgi:hypothetical protein
MKDLSNIAGQSSKDHLMFSEVSFLSDWINVVNSEAVLKNNIMNLVS